MWTIFWCESERDWKGHCCLYDNEKPKKKNYEKMHEWNGFTVRNFYKNEKREKGTYVSLFDTMLILTIQSFMNLYESLRFSKPNK